MRRRIWAALAMLIFLIGLACDLGGPKGTKEGGESKEGAAQCDTRIEKDHPKFINDGPNGFIVGRVWSHCTGKQPTQHMVEVFLERKAYGRFTHESKVFGGGGWEACTQIPGRRSIPCERKFPGCIPGVWRVNFKVTFAGDGGAAGPQSGSFEPDDGEMGSQEIKCPGPPEGGKK